MVSEISSRGARNHGLTCLKQVFAIFRFSKSVTGPRYRTPRGRGPLRQFRGLRRGMSLRNSPCQLACQAVLRTRSLRIMIFIVC